MLIHLIAVAPLAFLSCPWTHPVPCSHRRSCSYSALFWLSASTISVSRWSAQMMDQHGNITLASPNPGPWRSTCRLEWSLPISHVGIHRRGSAHWWVWISFDSAFLSVTSVPLEQLVFPCKYSLQSCLFMIVQVWWIFSVTLEAS